MPSLQYCRLSYQAGESQSDMDLFEKEYRKREDCLRKETMDYQQAFRNISMKISDHLSLNEWEELYKELVYWELALEDIEDPGIAEILTQQKEEANTQFARFIMKNYINWLNGKGDEKPILSHTALKEKVFPCISEKQPVFLFVIDNLRYDQWKSIQPFIHNYFYVENEDIHYSILPTATHYARNASFPDCCPPN